VLPRGRLVYRHFDFSEVPAAHRARALMVKLEAWQPFTLPAYWSGWHQGMAHVWAWSDDEVEHQLYPNETAVPETVLYPLQQDGVRVLEVTDGFEGQLWRQGQLILSRWWSKQPDESQWSRFLRAGGQPAGPRPAPEALAWTARPWLSSAAGSSLWWVAHERQLVTGIAAVLFLTLGWQVGQWWQVQQRLSENREQLDELRSAAADELAARDRTLGLLDRAERMNALIPQPGALELLDQVTEALPANGRLLQWEYESRQLSLLFEADRLPDPEQTIRSLQTVDALDEVLTERATAANALRVRAQISRNSP